MRCRSEKRKENQQIIDDIHAVFGLVPDDKVLYTARLSVLAKPYLPKPAANRTETVVERNVVLGAMLARMNENFARLKVSVEVRNNPSKTRFTIMGSSKDQL